MPRIPEPGVPTVVPPAPAVPPVLFVLFVSVPFPVEPLADPVPPVLPAVPLLPFIIPELFRPDIVLFALLPRRACAEAVPVVACEWRVTRACLRVWRR